MEANSNVRFPSIFGLNDWAMKFVAGAKKELSGESARLYEAGRPLYKYTFGDGLTYYEKVQPTRLSTSKFLALQDEYGIWLENSLWSDREIIETRELIGEPDPIIGMLESGELVEIQ